MKTTPFLLIIAILVSAIFGFFIGRSTSKPSTISDASVEKTTTKAEKNPETVNSNITLEPSTNAEMAAKNDEETKANETTTPPDNATVTETPVEVVSNENTGVATLNESDIPAVVSNTPTTEEAVLKRIKLGISDQKMSEVLESIAENMEQRKLAYVVSLGQDCSGIFHKIKDSIQVRLPALKDYKYPAFNQVRSSRQIADWYYKNGNLLIVEDPIASRNSIRPGSVMFFGKPNKKFQNMTIEMLTDRDNNYTNNGAIMHIAVVTSVRTDENGNVIDYTMMHGRNKKYHASRSGSKEKQSNRTTSLPPFGNWSQQWVAVANIATPAE